MSESEPYRLNNIIRQIIKKSLFTERQIEIILRQRDHNRAGFGTSRGAYYRQLGQSRAKLERVYYTVSLLQGIGVLGQRDIDVMARLAKQVEGLKNSDVFAEREDDVVMIFERIIKQACKT